MHVQISAKRSWKVYDTKVICIHQSIKLLLGSLIALTDIISYLESRGGFKP